MSDTDDAVVLWEARRRPGSATGELVGLLFGCGCAVATVVLVLSALFRQLELSGVVVVFGVALTLRLVGSARGRVVLRRDVLEVRVLRTRRYPWRSLRSVELVEGRIEVTPDGWVRRLPIPPAAAPDAFAELRRRHLGGADAGDGQVAEIR